MADSMVRPDRREGEGFRHHPAVAGLELDLTEDTLGSMDGVPASAGFHAATRPSPDSTRAKWRITDRSLVSVTCLSIQPSKT